MTALKLIGMSHEQPVFEQLPHDVQDNNVLVTPSGELMCQTAEGFVALPYVPVHLSPVAWPP